MDSRRLFVQLARTGSYAEAARDLRVARTTVMRRVAALEEEIGVVLLQRAGNQLVLTEAGHHLADAWAQALDRIDRVEEEIRAGSHRLAGTLRVRLPVLGTGVGIVGALASFSRLHPDIQLRVEHARDPVALKPGDFDVALELGRRANPDLLAQRLFELRMILVASPDYLARWGRPTHVDDLASHRGVLQIDDRGRSVPWTRSDGTRVRPPPTSVRTRAVGYALGFAAGGAGIARVPDVLAAAALAAGTVEQVLPDVVSSDSLSFVYLPNPSPRVRAFLDHVAAHVRAGLPMWSESVGVGVDGSATTIGGAPAREP